MRQLLIAFLLLQVPLQDAHSAGQMQVTVTVTVEKGVYPPGGKLSVAVLTENKGPKEVRVPRRVMNVIGIVPSVRFGFVNERGNVIPDVVGHRFPVGSEVLSEASVDADSIVLAPNAIYGYRLETVTPDAPGCYRLVVTLHSWSRSEITHPELLLGRVDSSGDAVKICVRQSAKRTSPKRGAAAKP